MEKKKSGYFVLCIGLCALLLLSVILSLCFGAMKISVSNTYQVIWERIIGLDTRESVVPLSQFNIIWKLRMPRVVMGVAVGGGLALCGIIMQAAVQNPMAEPYVLGISSGASLGATFSISLGLTMLTPFCAFIGSVLATVAVLLLASYGNKATSSKLVLSGTIVNALFSAVSNFIISMSGDADGVMTIKFWTMGSLAKSDWGNVLFPFILVLICSLFFLTQCRVLNIMLLGDEAAITLGISLGRYRALYMGICALLTGVLVANCGIIGFVGLMIPHIFRAIVGSDHRRLIPVTVLSGSCFMVWADAFSRSAVKNSELPIGIITALVGAPFFAYILIRKNYRFGSE
ncbi:MAG: FecCD family ABC transporter permease [Lachnospiraceae bacterium]